MVPRFSSVFKVSKPKYKSIVYNTLRLDVSIWCKQWFGTIRDKYKYKYKYVKKHGTYKRLYIYQNADL